MRDRITHPAPDRERGPGSGHRPWRRATLRAMPTSPDRQPLPYLVVLTALGVILAGRPHGEVDALTPAELSRAIQIATAARQKSGHLLPGSRTLSAGGKVWQRQTKRERTAERVAEDEREWERLVALTHRKRRKAKANAAPRYDVRVAWSEPLGCWTYAVRSKGRVDLRGFLGSRMNASAATLLRAFREAVGSVAWLRDADVQFAVDHIGEAATKRAKLLRPR